MQNAERKRKIVIQVAMTAVLIALIGVIGIGIAVQKARRDDPGLSPSIGMGQNAALPATLTDRGAIRLGKADAKVTVKVVADLLCPHCKEFEAANGSILEGGLRNGSLAVEYNVMGFLDNYSTSRYSSRAANASYCVAEADSSKYQAWLSAAFAEQPQEGGPGLTDDELVEIAKAAGYADPAVAQCITDVRYDGYVQAKAKDMLNTGINATPTVFVNDKQIRDHRALFTSGGLAGAITAAAQ